MTLCREIIQKVQNYRIAVNITRKNMSGRVVVVIVNYNGIEDTLECIESLKVAEGVDKIIVVDNASDNDEASIIKGKYKDIITIRSKKNGGFSYGNNIGVQWALLHQYEYVLLLNNDTVINKNMITVLKKYASKNIVCTPKMLYYYDKDIIWYGGEDINKKTGTVTNNKKNIRNNDNDEVRKCTFATGCCMLIHTDVFRRVGLLDESYFMYCEDTEFCIRLAENDIDINYVPSAILWHKISRSTGGDESAFSIYYMTRNRLLYIEQHASYFKKTAIFFTIMTRIIRAVQYCIKGNLNYRYFIKAIIDWKKGIVGGVELIKE